MQVHHDEGVAIHIDPESCAAAREGISEALTGERIGQPLSRESTLILGADVVPLTEGNTDGREIASAQTARRGRRHWHVRKFLAREPGDPTSDHRHVADLVRIGKVQIKPKPMMHGHGESDPAIVAAKPTNKAERSAAESVERRAEAKGNASQQSTGRTQSRETVSQALKHIRNFVRISRRAVTHPRWEPCARIGLARICAGGAR